MSTNLATILVGLGYDLSALEKGAPEAYRLINSQTANMSAEMKRTSREGAESFRLIDEALGIHLSRPLTRILTQEFPSLAKGLQSVLGAGIVGAIGVAGVELFDKIAKGIEHAQKAQEEFAKASQKTGEVFEDAMQSYEKAEKLRSLSGLNLDLFKIDSSSIDQARKYVDALAESFVDLVKKEEAARTFWTEAAAGAGDALHKFTSTPTALATEKLGKQFDQFKEKYSELARIDALKGTHDSAKFIADQLAAAKLRLDEMSAHPMGSFLTFLRNQIPITQTGQLGYSADEINRVKEFVDLLTKASTIQAAAKKDQGAKDDAARADAAKAAMEKERGEIQAQDAAISKWSQRLVELHAAMLPPKEAAALLDAELEKNIISFTNLDRIIGPADFFLKFHENLQQVIMDIREANSLKLQPPDVSAALKATAGAGPQLGSTGIAPILGAGGTAAAQFATFQADQVAQLRAAAAAYQDIQTPAQKYKLTQQELNLLLEKGLIDQAAYTAALQKANEELAQTEQRMEKLLREGGAAGGLQAFLMQMQGSGTKGTAGQFTFDLLNKGLQGFEDETVKALTGAKTNWSSFFESLDQMALKYMLNGAISQMLKALSGSGIFSSLFGGAGAGSSMPMGLQAIGGFASGTDSAPGGLAWVGENGPELLNLPAGSSVTPSSSLRGGSPITVHIDARGGEIGVEDKIARAISASAPQIVMRAVAEASEIQRRTPH